jgi:ABC-type lipoprotein export system ATPase subunit
MRELTGAKDTIKLWNQLNTELQDLSAHLDLAEEAHDEKEEKEVESGLGHLKTRLNDLEIRALLNGPHDLNAPILILDEATSSLDAKSEKEVQDALEYLMKDKLVLIIAHRFSTIQNVNKVIVINDKKIEASGNPQELAKKKGIYSDLLKFQVEGNKKLLESFDIY